MPDHNNHGFSSNHRPNGNSHNNKTTKVDPKDAQIDSLKIVIGQLQHDTTQLYTKVGELTSDTADLHKQLNDLNTKYEGEVKSLKGQLQHARKNESMFTVFATPYGCSIIIVFILALTIIALKKGFSVSKGDTNISVGDKK